MTVAGTPDGAQSARAQSARAQSEQAQSEQAQSEQAQSEQAQSEQAQSEQAQSEQGQPASAPRVVPLGAIQIAPDDLEVVASEAEVRAAPEIEPRDDELCRAEESTPHHHFEQSYAPPSTESSRRLARR